MTAFAEFEAEMLARFPDRRRLAAFLRRELDRKLNDDIGEGGMRDVVYDLYEAAEAAGWLDELIRAVRRPADDQKLDFNVRDLLDLTMFDLQPLVASFILEYRNAGDRRVIGVAVELRDNKFIRYFCARLQRVLGGPARTEIDPDGTRLSAELWSTDIAKQQILNHRSNLAVRNVVFPVWCDSADDQMVDSLWTGIRDELTDCQKLLTLVLVTAPAMSLPVEVIGLPLPAVAENDLAVWTVEVAIQLDWPPELAKVWQNRLVRGAMINGELNMAMVYSLLDRDISQIRDPARISQLRGELQALEGTA